MCMLYFTCHCVFSLVCRHSKHKNVELMRPVPPPLVPPRSRLMGPPVEPIYISIVDVEPREVANNDQTVSHNQVRVNGRDERSQSFHEELPSHTGASMLSVPPQAERWSSTPVLYSPPDVVVDGLSRSARCSNISQGFLGLPPSSGAHLVTCGRGYTMLLPSSISSPPVGITSDQSNILPLPDNATTLPDHR